MPVAIRVIIVSSRCRSERAADDTNGHPPHPTTSEARTKLKRRSISRTMCAPCPACMPSCIAISRRIRSTCALSRESRVPTPPCAWCAPVLRGDLSAAPQVVDDQDYDQRQDCGRHHPTDHRRRNALHDTCPRAVTPQRRHEPEHDREDGHELGPHPVHGPVLDRPHELRVARFPFPATVRESFRVSRFPPRLIQVNQHHNTRLCCDPRQGDEAY